MAVVCNSCAKSLAEPSLTDQESKEYARACFNVVKNKYHCDSGDSIFDRLGKPERTYYEETYSYWPSKVLSVDAKGALIQAKVEVTYNCQVGGNNGWGEAVNKKDVYVFTCLTENVAKGSYPKPDVFLRDSGGKGYDVWAYKESTPTRHNVFLEDTSTRKGYDLVTLSTEDVYNDYWSTTYWGLDLAKKYFSEHMSR